MIKADLVKRIADKYKLSQKSAGQVVQTLLDEMVNGLIKDSRLELRRFGVFGVKHQAPRTITLPSGKKIKHPAQKVVTFTPSSRVKKKLNPPKRKIKA